jgi:hypothetical protein
MTIDRPQAVCLQRVQHNQDHHLVAQIGGL